MPKLDHGTARPKPWTSHCRVGACTWTATAMTTQALDAMFQEHYAAKHATEKGAPRE
jgi:hypothetical protein